MSTREVAHRLAYRVYLEFERHAHARRRASGQPALERLLRDDLKGSQWRTRVIDARRTSRARFLSGSTAIAGMRSLFETVFRQEHEATLRHAERAQRHEFEFFGRTFRYGSDIDWQADPVTGVRWPAVFHADVPIHGGDIGFGDVKYVWELNRHQFLIDLAKAYALTHDRRYITTIERFVRSWIANNPYGTGVNWACTLEPAFRAWSWLWAYHLTSNALEDSFHVEWLGAFHDHGRFIERHLEHYASPFNHLIGEASALFALGACFPEFRAANQWMSRGQKVLEHRLRDQFYPDGGSVEQSTFYHHATVGFYLLAALVGRQNQRELSPEVWGAIERGLEFSMWLIQPNGLTPAIGGADDGKPIRMEHLPFWDFRPYLAIGAVLFHRADFKAAAGRFFEDAAWLLGPASLEQFEAIGAEAPAATSVLLARSGYAVTRSDWSERADYLCLDIGEQAAGMRSDAVPNSMHGHADCLSVVVWLDGKPVLVDSGLFAYNCGGPWEAHFRETAAHSTARVDGRDQATHVRKMAWTHSYRASIEGNHSGTDGNWTVGSHDGFARGPNGVTHRRAVWWRPQGYVVICDEFIGQGEHDLEVHFQFAPGVLERTGRSSYRFNGVVDFVWTGSCPSQGDVGCGGDAPSDGWICTSLGVSIPAPHLTLRTRTAAPRTTFVTALVPALGTSSRVSLIEESQKLSQSMVTVLNGREKDWIAVGGSRGAGAIIDTDALMAIATIDVNGRTSVARVGGSHGSVDASRLMDLEHALDMVGRP